MKVKLTNLRPGTIIACAWQETETGGFFQPAGHWKHHEGNESEFTRGIPQKFGYYIVRATLPPDYKTFEHVFPVTEELQEIKVSYRKI